jgi:hypothetical protein
MDGDDEPHAVAPGHIEHLAGRTNERSPREILLIAKVLAHHHQLGAARPLSRYHLSCIAIERAARAEASASCGDRSDGRAARTANVFPSGSAPVYGETKSLPPMASSRNIAETNSYFVAEQLGAAK